MFGHGQQKADGADRPGPDPSTTHKRRGETLWSAAPGCPAGACPGGLLAAAAGRGALLPAVLLGCCRAGVRSPAESARVAVSANQRTRRHRAAKVTNWRAQL